MGIRTRLERLRTRRWWRRHLIGGVLDPELAADVRAQQNAGARRARARLLAAAERLRDMERSGTAHDAAWATTLLDIAARAYVDALDRADRDR